ncbi:piggyBac transposable element-derived protein 4-like [Alosa sapidissima]|uniref:piggyBac transposable element-derived protein 4-like n=1 Tax=Alosa sapidissima TaxID=34773 RepID=UPI001C084ED4|nr:piggyBac transposable element-derived protein 4-like [Alosa sapidissima]
MRWFLNYLIARFQALYEVDGKVSVDESMIKFKGRLSFRQYLPMKPTKWGVKVWVMAESSTGYVTNFQVYAGREGSMEKGLAHRVVMDLARPYYGSHLSIYMDNFYTGVNLLEEMKTHGLNACGTVRANRAGLPKNERLRKKASMEKHEFRVAQKGELTFCIWQDTKTVMLLSNHHDPTQTGTVNRRKDRANQVPVVVPASLADYQKYMKGVNLIKWLAIMDSSIDRRNGGGGCFSFSWLCPATMPTLLRGLLEEQPSETSTEATKAGWRTWQSSSSHHSEQGLFL